MTTRHKITMVPFVRGLDGQFDLPADAGPIAGVSLGPVDGAVSPLPVIVWVPYITDTYEDAD